MCDQQLAKMCSLFSDCVSKASIKDAWEGAIWSGLLGCNSLECSVIRPHVLFSFVYHFPAPIFLSLIRFKTVYINLWFIQTAGFQLSSQGSLAKLWSRASKPLQQSCSVTYYSISNTELQLMMALEWVLMKDFLLGPCQVVYHAISLLLKSSLLQIKGERKAAMLKTEYFQRNGTIFKESNRSCILL